MPLVTPIEIVLTAAERTELERRSRLQTGPIRDVERARIILALADDCNIGHVAARLRTTRDTVRKWGKRFERRRFDGLGDDPRSGRPPVFFPEVTTYATKIACELPDEQRRSLSVWTCQAIADTLARDGIVESISADTVLRMLTSSKLKPWRVHHWLSLSIARDGAFREKVEAIRELYTRPLGRHERVLSADEKTSIQPRPRKSPTKPARKGNVPVRVEHEYSRAGATNLIAAFDTRTGKVIGICRRRKRQFEFIELLEAVDRDTPKYVTDIWIVCDNVSTHHGKLVQAWLAKHPRFRVQFTPVHCSWMNQVEQWFSIIQRKRLGFANFADIDALEERIQAFIDEWNDRAHGFAWKRTSFDKVLAKCSAVPAAA